MIDYIKHLDQQLLLAINSIHSPIFDTIMWWVSKTQTWVPLYIFIIYLLVKRSGKRIWIYLIAATVLILLSDQLSDLIKNHVQRLRPTHCPEIEGLVHLVREYRGGLYGFVSSHAANSFAVATFISLLFKKRYLTAIMFVYAVLVSYSRMYLGVHYPLDVLCGALLGTTIGWLVYFVINLIEKRTQDAHNS